MWCGQECGKPNGKYEDASYHHQNSSGPKSPAPKDGQTALNHSVQIKTTSSNRIGLSKKQIVVLKQTGPGVYHGYIVELEQLSEEMKTILIRSKLIHPKLLKIYWPPWSL